jgi:hypothetical protein
MYTPVHHSTTPVSGKAEPGLHCTSGVKYSRFTSSPAMTIQADMIRVGIGLGLRIGLSIYVHMQW